MEASITIEMIDSYSIVEIIEIFRNIGWTIYNNGGKVELMSDDYSWDTYNLTYNELYEKLIETKKSEKCVGLNLFYENGNEGTSLLTFNSNEIILDLSIYRRIIKNNYTDMSWYIQNIVDKMIDENVKILTYKAEDYCD